MNIHQTWHLFFTVLIRLSVTKCLIIDSKMFSPAFEPFELDTISLDTVSLVTRFLEVQRFFCKFEHMETQPSFASCLTCQFCKESFFITNSYIIKRTSTNSHKNLYLSLFYENTLQFCRFQNFRGMRKIWYWRVKYFP